MFIGPCIIVIVEEQKTNLMSLAILFHSITHRTKNNTANVVIQQNSRKLLMMGILMSETC